MEKVYKVFVSSPSIYMQSIRQNIFQIILKMGMMPVGMELFPADYRRSLDHIETVLTSCDYCICITASRYGTFIDKNERKSFTEAEYDMALKLGIPTLGFPHNKPDPKLSGGKNTFESAKQHSLLIQFNEKLKRNQAPTWSDKSGLYALVQQSLERLKESNPREGFMKFSSMIPLLKDAICYFQGDIIKYISEAHDAHEELVKELNDIAPTDVKDNKTLLRIKNKLNDVLDDGLLAASTTAYSLLEKYFRDVRRKKQLPRICLKLNHQSNNSLVVYTHSRNNKKNASFDSPCMISENSAFSHIEMHGNAYFCNNIVEKIKNGDYKNPRLNTSRGKNINVVLLQNDDSAWKSRWLDPTGDMSSCYRSTMVIPLTLVNNNLPNSFWKNLRNKVPGTLPIKTGVDSLTSLKRTVFGYLGFDSTHTDYFCEKQDISMSYCLADFLCIYLYWYHYFTTFSRYYYDAILRKTIVDKIPMVE